MKAIEKFVAGGLYAVLLTPLVFMQSLMHPLITLKTVVFQTVIEILFACYVALALAYPEYRPRRTLIFFSVFFLLAALVLSAVFGVHPARSFWSIPERLTGIFLMCHLAAFFCMLSGMREKINWQRYFGFSVIVSFFVALFPVIQLIFPSVFFESAADHLRGTVGNPIFLASYLLFHVFIAGWLATAADNKSYWSYVYAVIGFFDFFVLIFTHNRGAVVGLLCAGAVFSVFGFFRRGVSFRARSIIIAVWIFLIGMGGVIAFTREAPVWEAVPVVNRFTALHLGIAPRLIAWQSGIEAFFDRPFFGWGWENFYYAMNTHYNPILMRSGTGESFFDKPHNVILEFLITTGIVGLGAYLFLLGAALFAARRHLWILALMGAYVAQNLFAFDTVTSYAMFFILLAYLDSRQEAPVIFRHTVLPLPLYPYALIIVIMGASTLSFYTNYRIARASHLEWTSINYLAQKYIPEGLDYFDQALTAPTPYAAYIKKDIAPFIGQLYRQNVALPDAAGLARRSARELEAALVADPNHYGFHIGFADFITQVHDLDPLLIPRGMALVARAERLSPRRQTTHYVLSKLLYLKGDAARARDALRVAVQLDPEVGEAHLYYALFLLETNNIKEAGVAVDRAAALGRLPRTAGEARLLASHFGDANDYTRAEFYFQQALLLQPGDRETKMKLGIVYYLHGKPDAARRLISEIMKTENLKQSPQYHALQPILKDLGLE